MSRRAVLRAGVLVLFCLLVTGGLQVVSAPSASADSECYKTSDGTIWCKNDRNIPGGPDAPNLPGGPGPDVPYDVYRTPACRNNHAPPGDPNANCMGASRSCDVYGEAGAIRVRVYYMWNKGGDWRPQGEECLSPGEGELPEVTPAMVLHALKGNVLPSAGAKVNPADGRTLVNFPTIFFTQRGPYQTTITLLGQPVQIRATPTSYAWHWGDGTSSESSSPGGPYPNLDVTHEYAESGPYPVSVDVTYKARWNAGDGWQLLDAPITVTDGPSTPVTAVEKIDLLGIG